MEGSMPPGNNEPQDVTMTNPDDGAGNIFDEMLAEMDGQWGSQDPFMLQNEVPPEHYIDPALFAQSLGMSMPDIYGASPSASASPTRQEEQPYPFGIDSSPVRPVEAVAVAVSSPIREQANTPAASSEYSPNSAGLHTPTRRDRGHYGSARRRTGALSNFHPIAASPRREAAQTELGYTFEPIPEHQQGILSPSHYINEDLPEFRSRRVIPEPASRYDNGSNFPEELGSPCLAADPDAFEGASGGFDSQGTETGAVQDMVQLQNVLQFPNQFPVAPPTYTHGITIPNSHPSYGPVDLSTNANGSGSTAPTVQQFDNYTTAGPSTAIGDTAPNLPNYVPVALPTVTSANTTVPAVSNGSTASNTIAPWASGLTFQQELDPERRAKMQEIASVSHMLLTSKHTVFAAKKAKVLQAGQAADEVMRNKKPTRRARKNTTTQGNTNANSSNYAPPTSTNGPVSSQPASIDQPALSLPTYPIQPASTSQLVSTRSSTKSQGRNVSNPSNLTNEERIAQFWNGRLDKFGNELEASFLCHGSLEQYSPEPAIENTAANQSTFDQYIEELPNDHPKLAENTPDQEVPHSELMLYSEMMNERNFERAVFSGQVVVVSYDINSDWWPKIRIYAWNRFAMAYCLDEIAIMITPFHIIFGRIPRTGDTAMLRKDWRLIMGLVERSFKTPVVGAEEKTWAYLYRLIPCTAKKPENLAQSRDQLSRSPELLVGLNTDTVYNKRIRQFPYYVPPVGEPVANREFTIRVGRFGEEDQYDRPRVEIRDLGGQRVIRD